MKTIPAMMFVALNTLFRNIINSCCCSALGGAPAAAAAAPIAAIRFTAGKLTVRPIMKAVSASVPPMLMIMPCGVQNQ